MYIRFTQKASVKASMRKALVGLALLVVMLQMASLPAMAKPQQQQQQQSSAGGVQAPTPSWCNPAGFG